MGRLFSRRTSTTLLCLLALFLLGTVIFLSTVRAYFSIDDSAYILPEELGTWDEIQWGGDADTLPLGWAARYPWLATMLHRPRPPPASSTAAPTDAEQAGIARLSAAGGVPPVRNNTPTAWSPSSPPEKIPRIIHQTWKDDTLPPKWQAVSEECRAMHPDYEYMLWSDAASREFIVQHYPWFLSVFDNYPYAIQRADAIRYFVLHKYGGVYIDLDVGCLRRFDPLLRFEVILPKTIPVGVSNDIMFAARGHPFMEQLIHNLVTFNHQYLTNYPTVMFSTGPMFVSASYGIYVEAHGAAVPSRPTQPAAGFEGLRVLPKSLYGKNAKPLEAPDAFFRHFYGSSWHANDAGFLIFLRDHGRALMFLGACIVAWGAGKTILPRLLHALGHKRRGPRRPGMARNDSSARWISLPLRSEPAAPPATSRSGRSRGAGGYEMLSRDAPRGEPRVAAPRPQRFSVPMFDLADHEHSDDAESSDSGEGASGPQQGLLAWAGSGFARPASSMSGQGASMHRSGTASKSKKPSAATTANASGLPSSGTLYLPAFFVGGGGSPESSGSSGDAYSSGGHSRGNSLGAWAANLLPMSWRAPSPGIPRRTPSPSGLSTADFDVEARPGSADIGPQAAAQAGSGKFAQTWTPQSDAAGEAPPRKSLARATTLSHSDARSRSRSSSYAARRASGDAVRLAPDAPRGHFASASTSRLGDEDVPPPYAPNFSWAPGTGGSSSPHGSPSLGVAELGPHSAASSSHAKTRSRPGLVKRPSRGTLRSITPAVVLDMEAAAAQDAAAADEAQQQQQGTDGSFISSTDSETPHDRRS